MAKQRDSYVILDSTLRNRYGQPIKNAERNLNFRGDSIVLTVTTNQNKIYRYQTYRYRQSYQYGQTVHLIPKASSSDPFLYYLPDKQKSHQYPQRDPDNYVISTSWNYTDSRIDSIRITPKGETFYLKNGDTIFHEKAGRLHNFLDRSYVEYKTDYGVSYVLDILTRDTVLNNREDSGFEAFIKNGKFYFIEYYRFKDSVCLQALDTTDNTIVKLVFPHTKRRTFTFQNGLICEYLSLDEKSRRKEHATREVNLYEFPGLQPIVKGVIEYRENGIQVFRAKGTRIFYVFSEGKLLGTFEAHRNVSFDAEPCYGDFQPENRLIKVTLENEKKHQRNSTVISTKSGYRKEFEGEIEIAFDEIYHNYKVYHTLNNTTRFGIYNQLLDSIEFSPVNQRMKQVGPDRFFLEDTNYNYRVVDFYGKILAPAVIEDYFDFEIGNQTYLVTKVNGKETVYNTQFLMVWNNSTLIGTGVPFLAWRKTGEQQLVLVDQNLDAISDKHYLAGFCENNVFIVLNPDYSIDYLPVDSFKR